MNENRKQDVPESERAIARRLGSLRALPVDTSRLDKALQNRLPPRDQPPVRAPGQSWIMFRPMQAAAAASVLLLIGIVGALLLTGSGNPVLASATQMAQVHEEIVAGRVPVMQVATISEANRMLSSASPDAPSLPQMPEGHVMACCMKSVHHKKMACVLLKDSGTPVTLSVAYAADMQLPPAPIVMRHGASYRVQSVNGLSMVMTERNGKWLCLIGALPAGRLMDMAAEVQF